VEEPAFADVDSAKELPVTLQIGMDHAIGGTRRKTLKPLVQLARAEQRQHHQLCKVGAIAGDAGLLADHGVAAVAADGVIRLENLPLRAAVFRNFDLHAGGVLSDRFGGPAEACFDVLDLRQPGA